MEQRQGSAVQGGLDLNKAVAVARSVRDDDEAVVDPSREEAGRDVDVLVGPEQGVSPFLRQEAVDVDWMGELVRIPRQGEDGAEERALLPMVV